MIALFAALLLTLLSPAFAQGSAPAGGVRRLALVAGANDGGPGRVPLRYALSDADAMAAVLRDMGGVASGDLVLLREPDRGDLDAALADLGRRAASARNARRTEILFYYSGHSDEQGLLLGGERFGYRELRAKLQALPADVRIAVLDSCASGAMVREKGGTHVAPFLVGEPSEVEGHAFLTSSSATESAQEADRLRGSFFTHALVSGLRGGADTDGDGQVTLNEAYRFAYDETLLRTEDARRGAQHPAYDIQLSGTGDLVMTDLRSISAALSFSEGLSGRLFIRNDQKLVAEVFKPAGAPMILGLEPGVYQVTLEQGQSLYQAEVRLTEGETLPIDASRFTSRPRLAATARGAEELDHAPLSVTLLPMFTGKKLQTSEQRHNVALSFTLAHSGALDGFSGALAGSAVNGDMRGVQGAIGASVAGGDARGMQGAVGASIAGGDVRGLQGAVGGSIAGGEMRGVQGAVGVSTAGGDVRGIQAAVGGAVAGGDLDGGQTAVGLAITGGEMHGLQAAVGGSFAEQVRGTQWAVGGAVAGEVRGAQFALINVGRSVNGAQVGLINIAGEVSGAQVGLVNIAKKMDGAPVGLVSIAGDGMFDAEIWADSAGRGWVGLKSGSRWFYSGLAAGIAADGQSFATAGYLGVRTDIAAFDLDIDAAAYTWQRTPFNDDSSYLIPTARASLAFPLARHLAPYVGASLGLAIPFGEEDPLDAGLLPDLGVAGGSDLRFHPGFFAGIRI